MSSSPNSLLSSEVPVYNSGRDRQWAKIGEISQALREAGLESLDQQAESMGLSRSTAWSILSGQHKNSGLTTSTIGKMLSTDKLPAPVRKKLLEYVAEKALGLYGDSPARVEEFKQRLARLQPRSS